MVMPLIDTERMDEESINEMLSEPSFDADFGTDSHDSFSLSEHPELDSASLQSFDPRFPSESPIPQWAQFPGKFPQPAMRPQDLEEISEFSTDSDGTETPRQGYAARAPPSRRPFLAESRVARKPTAKKDNYEYTRFKEVTSEGRHIVIYEYARSAPGDAPFSGTTIPAALLAAVGKPQQGSRPLSESLRYSLAGGAITWLVAGLFG